MGTPNTEPSSTSTTTWPTTDDPARGREAGADPWPDIAAWRSVRVSDPAGAEWRIRARMLPWVPGWWVPGGGQVGPRMPLERAVLDEWPVLGLLLLVVPAVLLVVEVAVAVVAAPLVWAWRRLTGRSARVVVRCPEGYAVKVPVGVEGSTVRARRAALADLIRAGGMRVPDEAPDEEQRQIARLTEDPTISCAGPGQPLIRRR